MKPTKSCILAFALLFCVSLFAQNEQLMTIDGKPVYKTEFESIFKKNNKETSVTRQSLDEYIDLFVKFKLKVTEAERLGFDTISTFKSELEGYRKQLAKPYLTDNQLTDELIKEAFLRMQTEVRASHILIKIEGSQTAEDTLKAYKKAMEIKKRIVAGENFSKLAISLSDDPSAKQNGGDLGFFTGLTMVYSFETAAYNTALGEVSDPVRSSFGYHIIKVTDRRTARGELKVAHILIKVENTDPAEKKEQMKNKINEIYELAKKGEDFATLAKKFSEDKTSSEQGGILPIFGTGKMVESFEDASFGLKNIGDVSKPFETAYGWHIVTLLEKKPVGKLEELKPQIVRRISRDDRSKLTKQSFLNRLRKDYNLVEYKNNVKAFYKLVDSNVFAGTWSVPKFSTTKKVFEFGGKSFTQEDFAKFIDGKQRKAPKENIPYFVETLYSQYLEAALIDFEDSNLENKYPEFKALLKEYRDGILLFDLTSKMVWNKAVEDSAGLQAFYDEHKAEYMWKKRAESVIFKAKNKKLAEAAKKLTKKGNSPDEVLKAINVESQLNLTVESITAETGTNTALDKFEWKPGISDIMEIDGQFVFVNIKNVLEPQPKKIEEARGSITAAYQNYLEDNWIRSLRDRYKISVNKDVLYSVQ